MWVEFIAKYWLQVLFGLIVTVLTTRFRKIKAWFEKLQTEKKEKNKAERMKEISACVDELKPMLADIAKQSAEADESLRTEMNVLGEEVKILKSGVLAIQGDNFKAKCRRYMEDMDKGRNIDFKAYESLRHDHNAYNLLGGNSDGDELFELVTHRYEHQQAGK